MLKASIKKSDYPCAAGGYEIDLTNGCDVGCIYCALSLTDSYELLDIEEVLNSPIPPRGFYLSPNSDPFSEKAKEAAHRILERFFSEGVSVVMFTKHKIPEKTMRLMKKYSYLIIPTISLARLDNELNFYIEPGGASVSDRIYTIKKLADYGLKVKARLNPVFPGVDDKQELLEEIIETYAKAGVYTVKAAYAVMRDSRLTQWMIKKVKDHPVLSQSWKQMTETIKIYLGKGNVPPLETRIKFYSNVNQMCRKHGLKFGICSTLDYPILSEKLKGIPVCKSIMTYYHGYIKPEGWAQ